MQTSPLLAQSSVHDRLGALTLQTNQPSEARLPSTVSTDSSPMTTATAIAMIHRARYLIKRENAFG